MTKCDPIKFEQNKKKIVFKTDDKKSVISQTTKPGKNGKSAYEVAVENGFVGTEAEWLASLQGADSSVLSVNGEIGDVVLTASDVGAATTAQGAKADTAVQPADLNALDADDIDDDTTAHKFVTANDLTTLANTSGVNTGDQDISDFETSAELNTRDTDNRKRANHTGTQAISTVSGLQSALNAKAPTTHTHTKSQITDFGTYVESVTPGTNITIDNSDPTNPVISSEGGGDVESVNGQTGVVELDADDVGLGNVDNTSDANKPISTATQTALDDKRTIATSANNVYTTNGSGEQSVWEYSFNPSEYTFPVRSEGGVIRVGTPSNDSDATTKVYVDDALDTKADYSDLADYLPLSGGTLSGELDVNGLVSMDSINIGNADPLRNVNIKGSGNNARLSIQGTTTSDFPGIEFTNDGNANRALIRMDSVSTTGTKFTFWNESVAGSLTQRLTISEDGHLQPGSDSTYTLGTSSAYWSNTYTDKIFFNSTATIAGSTAGQLRITGDLTVQSPDNTWWKITVANDGSVTTVAA